MSEPGRQIALLVLARQDATEAMRVAAGLTIFGHRVRLVFMHRPPEDTPAARAQAELLELADIVPQTTIAEMAEYLELLDSRAFSAAIREADQVISL